LQSLQIRSYGVGVTTLEEVFLSVGKDDEFGENIRNTLNQRKSIKKEEIKEEGFIDNYAIADSSVSGTLNIFLLHFWALSVKWWLTSIWQLKTLLLEVIIPIILIIAGLFLANVQFFRNPLPFSIQPSEVFKSNV